MKKIEKLLKKYNDLFVNNFNLGLLETYKMCYKSIDEILETDEFIEDLDYIITTIMKKFTYKEFLNIFSAWNIDEIRENTFSKEEYIEFILRGEIYYTIKDLFEIINIDRYKYNQQKDAYMVKYIRYALSDNETYIIIEYFDNEQITYRSSDGKILSLREMEEILVTTSGYIVDNSKTNIIDSIKELIFM